MLCHQTPFKRNKVAFIVDFDLVELSDIDNVLRQTYEGYAKIKQDFNIFPIIEFLLSALRQSTPEAKFLMAMTSLECLCSYVPKFASNKGMNLSSNDIQDKIKKIRKFSRQYNLNLSNDLIYRLADVVAYKAIGSKTSMKYILNYLKVAFTSIELNNLFKIRGKLVHTGVYPNTIERF